MNAIALVLVALPAGLLLRERRTALAVRCVVFFFIHPFQTVQVNAEQAPAGVDWSCAVVNLAILLAGAGLVVPGARVRARRAARSTVAV